MGGKLKGWGARGAIAAIALGASTASTAASMMTDAERTILIGLIPRETLIVYEANALTTHVTIFTDSEYPPCSKLREWVPKLTSYGVEVRYAGAPRKEPYPEMMSIWCASDRRNAMDRVKRGERVEITPCDHPLAMHKSVGRGKAHARRWPSMPQGRGSHPGKRIEERGARSHARA